MVQLKHFSSSWWYRSKHIQLNCCIFEFWSFPELVYVVWCWLAVWSSGSNRQLPVRCIIMRRKNQWKWVFVMADNRHWIWIPVLFPTNVNSGRHLVIDENAECLQVIWIVILPPGFILTQSQDLQAFGEWSSKWNSFHSDFYSKSKSTNC